MKTFEKNEVIDYLSRIFNNRYRFISPIGAGGMGSVFLVESNDSYQIERALKIIEKENQDTFAEIQALRDLNHPGIPKVIEVAESEDYVFIIQELVRGKSLKTIIEENGKIAEEATLLWINDIADILTYLHDQGFIHRDIKPTNIMITEDGQVKLIDFGLAKKISVIDEIDQQVIGTRNYTAPERYDRRPADRRTDIYGFGCVCYYLATGIAPLEVTSSSRKPMRIMLKNLNSIESKGLKNLIEQSISINPDKRFQNFNEVRYHLKQLDTFSKAQEDFAKKRRFSMFGIILTFLLGVALICSGFVVRNEERKAHYEELIKEAQTYFDQNNLKEAKQTYTEAINFMPKQLTAYQGLFETETKQGNFEGVISSVQELFDNNPEAAQHPRILYLLGNAYYELGEYDQAQNYLIKATEMEPTIENHLVLALNYSAQKDYNSAQQTIKKLQDMGGDINVSTYLSGQISKEQENYDQAAESFNQVINSTSDSDLKQRAVKSLALLYEDRENYADEVTLLNSVQNDPVLGADNTLKERLGYAYYNQARDNNDWDAYNSATQQFSELIDKGINSAYIYRNLAIIYQELDDFEAAREVLDEMEAEYPDNPTVNIQKAYLILDEQAEVDESKRDYSEFVTEYNLAQEKDDGSNQEIKNLTDRYNELYEKGWLKK